MRPLPLVVALACVAPVHAQSKPSARHTVVVVEQTAGSVGFFDSTSGQRLGSVKVGSDPHEITLTKDGRTAYVTNFGIQDYDETIGTPGASISVIDVPGMVETRRFYTGDDRAPHGVKLRPPHEDELYVNVERGHAMLVYDVKTGAVKRRFAVDPGTHNMIFANDGETLYLMAGKSGVIAVNAQDGRELRRFKSETPVRGLAFTKDERFLVAAGRGEVLMIAPKTMTVARRYDQLGTGQILYAIPTPDERYIIAPAVWDTQLLVIDRRSGEVVKRIVSGPDPVNITMSPDGRKAYASNARGSDLTVLDMQTLAVARLATGRGPNGIAVAPALPGPRRRVLHVGTVLPLSGRDGPLGREMSIGYEYWKNSVNAAGGIAVGKVPHRVELVVLDSRSNGAAVPALTQVLYEQHDVQLLLGTYETAGNEAMADVANRAKLPLVTSIAAAEELYGKGRSCFFGINGPASAFMKGTVDMALAQQPQPSSLAILSSDAPAQQKEAQALALYAAEKGLKLTPDRGVVTFAKGSSDFSATVRQLQSASPDLLVVLGDLMESVAVTQAILAQDWSPMALSFSVGPSVPYFASPFALGQRAVNLLGATQWTPEAPTRGHDRHGSAKEFGDMFWATYNMRASYLSAGAVATGLVYEDALRRAGSLAPGKLCAALRSTRLSTFYGDVAFDGRGLNAAKPIYTIQLAPKGHDVEEKLVWPNGTKPVWPYQRKS